MATKFIRGYSEKQIYRNERFSRGVVSTNDPLGEGSFRRLINFKVSNQNASIENREPFLTVPLYDMSNKRVTLSKDAFVFTLNDSTEYAYIFDLNQKYKQNSNRAIYLKKDYEWNDDTDYVIDGDTVSIDGKRYRLAIIDTPELEDDSFLPVSNISGLPQNVNYENMGEQAKGYTELKLEGNTFDIVQFDFQSDFKDEYNREMVFIVYKENEQHKILNIELLKNGLAFFYGQDRHLENREIYLVNKVYFDGIEFKFKESFEDAYNNPKNDSNQELSKSEVATGYKYLNTILLILDISEEYNIKYDKPVVYKIKKETDLKQLENGKIIKRVVKTVPINELRVKTDLEITSDMSLKYSFVSKDTTVVNGKYADQYVNFLVNIQDQFGRNIYRGLIELTHRLDNPQEGLEEIFYLKTYKKPEASIELQDVVNVKPNILNSNSIIPQRYVGSISNIKGYSNPSVDIVLLQTELNANLERSNDPEENKYTKYFNPGNLIYEDLKNYKLNPIFKAPNINGDKNKYMFRWDFVNLNEIDVSDEEEIKRAKPFYRTAWTKLDYFNLDDPENNISENKERQKKIATSINSLRTADEIYIIKDALDPKKIDTVEDVPNFDEITENEVNNPKTIIELQKSFDDFIDDNSLEQIKNTLIGDTILIDGKEYVIVKPANKAEINLQINKNSPEDSLSFEETLGKQSKVLSQEEIIELFESEENENKKIGFVFAPIDLVYKDTTTTSKVVSHAWKTKGITFDLSKDRKKVVPIDILMGDLLEDKFELGLEEDFFEKGVQATFYLTTYESVDKLTEPDEFYDVLAYKKTTATYLYKNQRGNRYEKDDFIDDKLDQESFAISYSKYITKFEDRIVAYGNVNYKNTVFISEDGAPYYFTLLNSFEFDHEVIHVQTFKNIILVFTINDIWVIYPWEESSEFEGIVTITKTYRYKKILYNISSEEKNKPTIKNITRYVTLMSNNVLYLIRPSTYIADETEFSLNILSQNIDAIVKDPLKFINERLKYYDIHKFATDYKMNLNATDNFIKLYYSTVVDNKNYTLILTYDILNNRWFEEDTISFGYPQRIYLLDSTTKYEMLTESNEELLITYQTDKYKNMMLDEYSQSYYDRNENENQAIKYYLDTGYIKLNEHLKKRFKHLQYTMKNIDSRKITFTYNFTVDDKQFESNFEPTLTVNESNEIIEILTQKQIITSDIAILLKMKEAVASDIKELQAIREYAASEIGTLDDFLLDFSNMETGDIMTVKQNLLGIGRLPRIQFGFTAKNRFYLLSYGIIYSEHGGKGV